jgi:iron(III) transport system permease protein
MTAADFRGPVETRRRIAASRIRSPWLVAAAAIAALAVLPIAALIAIAAGGGVDVWGHIALNVAPAAAMPTAALLVGVGVMVVVIGVGAAWLVTAYEFPGRKHLDWALVLPLAVPTYVAAFAYLDVLHPIGPLQTTLRGVLGLTDPRTISLPDIRSLPGAILLFGLVLYPYVYIATRAAFVMQAGAYIEVARTLGARRAEVLSRIALPLSRPAIAVGTSLALMETLNDIGASEFLGIRTLTRAIYSTWINQSNLAGAAQLAVLLLAVVVGLVVLERWGRRHQRFAGAAQRMQPPDRTRLSGARGWLALAFGATPVVLGFLVPIAYLAQMTVARIEFAGVSPRLVGATLSTIALSAAATAIVLVCGLVVVYAARIQAGRLGGGFTRAASLGYALPGTVLAVALLAPVAAFDNWLDGISRQVLGIGTGLLIAGSSGALIYAYVVRFLAISVGGIESGFAKISVRLDHSARLLGRTAGGVLSGVHLALLRPALGAVAILVFVDCMKELPATLLLRPLNVETLATLLYGEAARGTHENGAIAALAIVLVGLAPVILLARFSRSSAIHGSARLP